MVQVIDRCFGHCDSAITNIVLAATSVISARVASVIPAGLTSVISAGFPSPRVVTSTGVSCSVGDHAITLLLPLLAEYLLVDDLFSPLDVGELKWIQQIHHFVVATIVEELLVVI
ncbi:hypothetical protein PF004_g21692 [Phytophthora fragariae]|uniref:Uncharacterized protein n=1 Tax=Phytophthora fragariae TaxID=53985 RepID=A0A6G0N2G4_9STRA|nr:hypothetical protein PF004_g21692 [Phytophthora fragariae]